MGKLSAEMRDAMAQVQGAFDKAEIYENFTPDPGTYDCILKAVRTKIKTDANKQKVVKANLQWQILDGANSGRTFFEFFGSDKPEFTGNLFGLVTLATGDSTARETQNFALAVETLTDLEGSLIAKVNVGNRYDSKNDKYWPTYGYSSVTVNN